MNRGCDLGRHSCIREVLQQWDGSGDMRVLGIVSGLRGWKREFKCINPYVDMSLADNFDFPLHCWD